MNANYGRWQVTRSVDERFAASIRNRDFSGVRVVECVCDPCTGRRLPQFVEQEPEPYTGVQITKAGRERFHLDGEDISLGAGDLVIWTSTRPAEFTVVERLHKVSLVLPWSEVQERLPRGTRFAGTVVDSRVGIGAVLYSHVDSLARQLELFSATDHAAVRRATLELLTAAMSHRVETPQRGLARRYLKQLQDYTWPSCRTSACHRRAWSRPTTCRRATCTCCSRRSASARRRGSARSAWSAAATTCAAALTAASPARRRPHCAAHGAAVLVWVGPECPINH